VGFVQNTERTAIDAKMNGMGKVSIVIPHGPSFSLTDKTNMEEWNVESLEPPDPNVQELA
jgi:hypothetical protein